MPEHEASAGSSSQGSSASIPWWVRVCRTLWRVLLYVWGTLIVGIVIGTIANINTTTTEVQPSKLFIIHLALTFPLPVFSSLGLLLLLTLLSWMGSHAHDATLPYPLSERNRSHML